MKTLSISEAQASLPQIAQEVLDGETLRINFHGKVLIMMTEDESWPQMRPPGYFADCLTPEENELENRLALDCPTCIVP